MNLTDEQLEIVDAAHGPKSISVIARAGTGKTTTACAIALDQPDTNFAYLAFNKKVSDEAKAKFPKHVKVLTAHSAAFRAVGKHYKERICRSPWKLKTDIAERFHAAYSDMGGSESVEDLALFATLETIDTFCASADIQIDERTHVPDGPYKKEIIGALARGLWTAMCDTSDWVPITDDCYLKMWQLAVMRNPASARTILGADKILFDEGQDASPAMLDITQRSGAPIILIGDPRQAIYSWRGAIDAFGKVDYPEFSLTQSWRFGPEIAQPANDILTVLKEFYLIDGRGGPGRVIVDDNEFFPNAVIARTNGGLVEEAVRIADDGGSIHIVGGTEHIFGWLKAAYALWSKRRAQHPAFSMFKSWDMLKEASGQAIGKSYKPFVDIVEQYRSQIPDLLMKLETSHTTAEEADTVLSTVHRYKGQEAKFVKIADDFAPFCMPNTDVKGPAFVMNEEEANLAYVAVTRARKQLDLGGFAGTLRESLKNARLMLADEEKLAS